MGPWARASAVVFALVAAVFLAAPLYAEHVAHTGPADNHLTDRTVVDGRPVDVLSAEGIPIGPTWEASFFLGADENGRDLAVRLLYGGRTSLLIGLGAVLLTALLAVPLALAAGYLRGRTDAVVSRLLDLIWSFPALMLGVLLSTAITIGGLKLGPVTISPGSKLIPLFVIGLVSVPYMARPLRGQVLALRERQFVDAALASGMRPLRVMLSELLPHLWTTIAVLSALLFVNAVVLEAALSFLGAGVARPAPSLGTLIADGLDNVLLSSHLLLVPSIALVVIAFTLSGIAEGVRRAVDPRGALPVGLVRER
jgi:peptide/nickel transport system permease protein